MKKVLLPFLVLLLSASALTARPGEKYVVTNAREFLEAIGSQRTIVVQPGIYDLAGEKDLAGDNFEFLEAYDGYELQISNVTGLAIEGSANWESHFITQPRYGYVMRFKGCQGITIKDIKAGHGPKSGYCTGGVLMFEGCKGISVEGCHLYGSGTEGFTFVRSQGVSVKNTIVKSCTYSILTAEQSQGISFSNCSFFDNQEFDLVNIMECGGIVFKACEFNRNRTNNVFFNVGSSSGIVLKKCTFDENVAGSLARSEDDLSLKGTKFSRNNWRNGKF